MARHSRLRAPIWGRPHQVLFLMSAVEFPLPKRFMRRAPRYSKEAVAANYGGTCILWMVVGPDGKPHNIRVVRTLGLGLDEKAIEAVKNWRFEPAMKDAKPVDVQRDVDVNFNLHEKELNTRILELEETVNA